MSTIRDIPFQRETIEVLEEIGIKTVYDLYKYEIKSLSINTLRLLTDPDIKADIEYNMSILIMSN